MKYLPEPVKKVMLGNPDSKNLLYQFTTAFPGGNFTGIELESGTCGRSREMQWEKRWNAYGVTYWLAPGHEYTPQPIYVDVILNIISEDPLLTGKFAAAITKGVQKNRGCYVTLKHFCCNNQEDNRNKTNAERQ